MKPPFTINQPTPAILAGTYANNASVGHSWQEFVIDFLQTLAFVDPPQAEIRARIVTSPQHAKMLLAAIADQVRKYEAEFGEITVPGGAPQTIYSKGGN